MDLSAAPSEAFWSGRRVVVTGHTGFKGAWLRLWLEHMGAVVTGYALPPPTTPSLHALSGGMDLAREHIADIRDADRLAACLRAADPEIVLHLAAQPLVRASYADPAETFDVNVTGTVRLIETALAAPATRVILVITTDKVYRNDERGVPFGEDDPLGGHDPYSASKAAAELVVASWRAALEPARGVRLATVRGGNVIGGGDYASDRLIPDLLRAVAAGVPLALRHPGATRPWQHVLDGLSGYLRYAEALHAGLVPADALNIGPPLAEPPLSVGHVVDAMHRGLGIAAPALAAATPGPREMAALRLDPTRARAWLGWSARLTQDSAIAWTARWHKALAGGANARDLVLSDIASFLALEARA